MPTDDVSEHFLGLDSVLEPYMLAVHDESKIILVVDLGQAKSVVYIPQHLCELWTPVGL